MNTTNTKPRSVEEDTHKFANELAMQLRPSNDTMIAIRVLRRELPNMLTTRDASIRREEMERIRTAIISKAQLIENPIETSHGQIDGSFYQIYRGHLEDAVTPKEEITNSEKSVWKGYWLDIVNGEVCYAEEYNHQDQDFSKSCRSPYCRCNQ